MKENRHGKHLNNFLLTTSRLLFRVVPICFIPILILSCISAEPAAQINNSALSTTENRITGIDVSKFQGTINWQSVKTSGIVFAYARAQEGVTIHDTQFVDNWQGMKDAGVIRGAYDFYVVEDSPSSQLEAFTNIVSLELGDLPPMVDIEQGSITASDGVAPESLISNFHDYLSLLEAHYGTKPIIYTNLSFWNTHMDDSFGNYPLWIAEYGVEAPSLPNGWDSWTIWQKSQSRSINGIVGPVDLDVFNGSLEQLRALQK